MLNNHAQTAKPLRVETTKMLDNNSYVLSGPKVKFTVPEGSIGKYLYDCLKKRDAQHINMIDVLTEKSLNTGDILQNSLKATKVLHSLGVDKGDVIVIIVETTLNYCIPLLGALYLGITAHLLNPLYSVGEIKASLSVSKPKLIICSELSIENLLLAQEDLKYRDTKIVFLDNKSSRHPDLVVFQELLENTPFVDPDSFEPEMLDSSDHGALILMSSGTTGLPKGVLITHENLRASFDCYLHEEFVRAEISDSTIFILPIFHVFGVLIEIISLSVGMKLAILNKFIPEVFLEFIQKHKPTRLFVIPPLLQLLANHPLVENYDLSSVKDIIVGGAPLGKELCMEVAQRMKQAHIRVVYGATEGTGVYTLQKYNKIEVGSVGMLVPHVLAKVCDLNTNQNLPPLEVGEIRVKSPMIMKGYVGNEIATKESFDEEGFYRTGDVGYYDKNENLYIVDRLKELIKYKAFQVSPSELEALISSHSAVKDCGVIGIPDKKSGEVPLAFVVIQEGVNVSEQDIIDFVAERISVQKRLRGGVRIVDNIPKTTSGKILRRELVEIFKASL